MLTVNLIQPPYFAGEEPDAVIEKFLLSQMEMAPHSSLILLPEYSNAGGLSDPDKERAALPRAKTMLERASTLAREKESIVGINVLEERDGKIFNSTYLFDRCGKVAHVYDKIHLPPSEISLGVTRGDGACVCDLDGIRFGFMTCYDVYFNEQIEYLAEKMPDVILVPGYQRGERWDIIQAQAKLLAFRCNAFVLRSSYSMDSTQVGGNTMVVSPDGIILENMGKEVGSLQTEIDPTFKYMRTAGFGGARVRGDEFIRNGLCPEIFCK